MAKPISMFQGPAPAAMGMMGQGLSEAGARIGQFYQQGLSDLGKGIASGIQGAASAYSNYKDAKAANAMTSQMLSSPSLSNQFLGIPQDASGDQMRKEYSDMLKKQIDAHGQFGGLEFSKQIMSPLMQYHQLGQQHAFELQKQAQSPAWGANAIELYKFNNQSRPAPRGVNIQSPESQPYGSR